MYGRQNDYDVWEEYRREERRREQRRNEFLFWVFSVFSMLTAIAIFLFCFSLGAPQNF
jgi:type IV secretory pathway component VirB8